MSRAIKWTVSRRRERGGAMVWEGTIEVPDALGHAVKVSATANEKGKALARAGTIAEKALDNDAVRAVLPPGAAPALKLAARALRSNAARSAFGIARRALS